MDQVIGNLNITERSIADIRIICGASHNFDLIVPGMLRDALGMPD
jgi:hypothetical protein